MPNVNGLHLMLPTSVSASGSSNSITQNPNGSVSFTNCTDVNLNGVFTTDYENYIILLVGNGVDGTDGVLQYRLRASGTDNTTASSYTSQSFRVSGTSETAGKNATNIGTFAQVNNAGFCVTWHMYGPQLAQPTVYRSLVTKNRDTSIELYDYAGTHNQSTSYDGLSIILNALNTRFSGKVAVYGMRK